MGDPMWEKITFEIDVEQRFCQELIMYPEPEK